jgi:hypothetical protein
MVRVPDPADDFDGCIDALVKNAIAEVGAMTPEQQDNHYLCRAVEHAIRMHQLDAPQMLIDLANRRMHHHLNRLRRRTREGHGCGHAVMVRRHAAGRHDRRDARRML